MKFTLSWLKAHLDTHAAPQEIADRLTAIGLEVEGLTNPAEKLAPFVIAYVQSAEQHPNADRLKVLAVDAGDGQLQQVVCGAPNARAGIKGVFAAPNTTIPSNGMVLKISKIRDVESRGMMCSAAELQLSEDQTGIIELPADAPVGANYADWAGLNDPVFEINITPNRPDCTGVRGIARDLAASGLGTLKPQKIAAVKGSFASPINVSLNFESDNRVARADSTAAPPAYAGEATRRLSDNTPCPYFIGRAFKGVKNGASPEWLQRRLTSIGLRPISALVDITNFMTFDQGRPLHVFDSQKVKGNICARPAKAGEKILALNGKDYELEAGMTVIADANHAEAIAGIMGGAASGCTETTTDVFLECAYFDPSLTTITGRKLGIISDARYRFERGVDPAFMIDGAEMATALILECCGGQASELVVAGAMPHTATTTELPFTKCKTLGGLDVDVNEQEKILTALGCAIKRGANHFTVTFPSWRPDMHGAADCVEEILRIKGFDAIPAVSLHGPHAIDEAALNPQQNRASVVRRALAARGMLEAVTWSFMPSKLAKEFGGGDIALNLLNPISADLDAMRPSILPNVLSAAKRNADRGFADVALFEVGPVYQNNGQSLHAAGLRAGQCVPRNWAGAARTADLYDAKADLLAALEAAKMPTGNLQATADAPSWYHPGRSGALRLGPNVLAVFGEIHPAILAQIDSQGPVAAFEIYLDKLPAPRNASANTNKPLADLPELQPVRRDFAFVVAEDIEADRLLKAIKTADKALIVSAELFDIYRGKGVAEGQKSLAIEVTYQPRSKTLTEPELEQIASKIVAAAAKTGAVLRG